MSVITLLANLPLPAVFFLVGCAFTFFVIVFLVIVLVPGSGERIIFLLTSLRRAYSRRRLSRFDHLCRALLGFARTAEKKRMQAQTGDLLTSKHLHALFLDLLGGEDFPDGGMLHIYISLVESDPSASRVPPSAIDQSHTLHRGWDFRSERHSRCCMLSVWMVVIENPHKAIEHLVQNHRRLLLRTAYGVVGNYDIAQDIVQDSLEKAYRALQSYSKERIERMSLKPWICKIVVHTALNHQRSEKKIVSLALSSDWFIEKEGPLFERPEFQLLRREMVSSLQLALDALPEVQKNIVLLRFFEGCRLKEIALQLDLKLGTVKCYLSRALTSLRIALEEVGG